MNDFSLSDNSEKNQKSLQSLTWEIRQSQGKFSLILAICNSINLQEKLTLTLQNIEIERITINPNDTILYTNIEEYLNKKNTQVLFVFGLELVVSIDKVLTSINTVREEFRDNINIPIVFWITDDLLTKIIRTAPDFYNWATTIEFNVNISESITYIQQTIENILNQILNAGAGKLLRQLKEKLNLGKNSSNLAELKLIKKELNNQNIELNIELEAGIEFILGIAAEDNCEESWKHYRKSLKLWRKSSNELMYGCLLFYIGRWHRTFADRHVSIFDRACDKAINNFQKSIDIFRECQRPDLIYKFSNALGDVLQRRKRWDELKNVASEVISLAGEYGTNDELRLARAYGFLSQVEISKGQWIKASEFAQKALDIFIKNESELSNNDLLIEQKDYLDWERSYHKGWYLLPLAEAQKNQGEIEEAIESLKVAKMATKPNYDAKLYIKILEMLGKLYKERNQYKKAFEIGQEQLSIEQQYGFRVFIGAGRLKPKKVISNPALQTPSFSEQQEQVALEINASERLQKVLELVERIRQQDRQLTLLYGHSGVGKSSLLQAGLIPYLKQESSKYEREIFITLQQEGYTEWLKELSRCFQRAGQETQNINSSWLDNLEDYSEENLKTIIFNQLQENHATIKRRKEFYNFLDNCLKIPFTRIIISIREDYMHYLLECDRFGLLRCNGTSIWNQSNLCYLGNFSTKEAESLIKNLNKNKESKFSLGDNLVFRLVDDLTNQALEIIPIELQILGSRIESKKIRTLADYEKYGGKSELFKEYLTEIINACGSNNEVATQLVLYLFTDENLNRPMKTKSELKANLGLYANSLDLIISVLVHSGLVTEISLSETKHYQLSHDYLVNLIHQQVKPEIIDELNHVNQKLQKALEQEKQQRERAEIAEIEVLNSFSHSLWLSNNQLEALIVSLKAAKQLKNVRVSNELKTRIASNLGNIVYQIQEKNRFEGHNAVISSVQYSPSGNLIASCSLDYTIKLWNLDGSLRKTFEGHTAEVNGIRFSPDGNLIASASADCTVRLWNLDGSIRKTFEGHQSYVNNICFSPDGNLIASASADCTVRLWNLDGSIRKTFEGHQSYVNSVCFSPDGNLIASASADCTVRLWNLDGSIRKTFEGHTAEVNSVRFSSPNGNLIASASADCTVRLWNLDDEENFIFYGHSSHVKNLSFSPDGNLIASASADGTIKLWDLDGNELEIFLLNTGEVTYISFSPDNNSIVSASTDDSLRVWDIGIKELHRLETYGVQVKQICFNANCDKFALANADGKIKVCNIDCEEIQTIEHHKLAVNSVSFSPHDNMIVSAGADHQVIVSNIDSKKIEFSEEHETWVNSVSFSPDGRMFASAGADGMVKIYFVGQEKSQPIKVKVDQRSVDTVVFSPDSQKIAVAGANRKASLWDIDGKRLENFEGHKNSISTICFSPNGEFLASASRDGFVKLWQLDSKEIASFQVTSNEIKSLNFSHDGRQVIVGGVDGISYWDIEQKTLKTSASLSTWNKYICCSPDGNIIISASLDNRLTLWNPNLSFELDDLLEKGCNWARNYLKNNPTVNEDYRCICDNI
jgi:WD40 repeat protein/tetratricopeptide (TPR) repeat protein